MGASWRAGGRLWTRTCVVILAVVLAVLLALPPAPASGAGTTTRLDWGLPAPMSVARQSPGVAAAPNGKLYAVGGLGCGGYCSTVEELDPATNVWTTKASLATPRVGPGLAAAPNGKLYAVGGANLHAGGCGFGCTTVEEYDPAANTWRARAPMPTGRAYLGLVAAPNGKLYAIGGHSNTDGSIVGTTHTTVEEYDPVANTWVQKAAMPTARLGLGLATAPNGKIYAVGGASLAQGGCGTECATVEEFDPVANTWAPKAPLRTGRSHLGLAAAPNGKLYAVGGFGCGARCAAVEEYDPLANAWRDRALLPTPRTFLAMATAPNGKLYAVGGLNDGPGGCGGNCAIAEEYDPLANAWARPRTRQPLPQPRFGFGSAVVGQQVYLFGGGNGRVSFLRSTLQYDLATDRWRELAPIPSDQLGATAALASNGRIYVMDGQDSRTNNRRTLEEFSPPSDDLGIGSWRDTSRHPLDALGADVMNSKLAAVGNELWLAGGGRTDDRSAVASFLVFRPPSDLGSAGQWFNGIPMPTPRVHFGLATAADGRMYAVGGRNNGLNPSQGENIRAYATMERYFQGRWEGPAGLSTLPAPRDLLELVAAPSGKLYAVGGRRYDLDGRSNPAFDGGVLEYDPAANAWTVRAPMPTPRFKQALALVGRRLLAIAGTSPADDALASVEEAQFSELPTASAGGPYTARSGEAVQLSATGSDPDGDALSFAWDVDGDLLYETAGQNPAPVVRRPSGTYPLRMRVLDDKGAFRIAETTLTVTCGPRPNVRVQTVRTGPGRVQATLTAGQGALSGMLRIGPPGKPLQNAVVDVQGGPSGITSSRDVPISGSHVVLTVSRQTTGTGAVTVPLAVSDGCGEWPTFVGFGSGV